MEAKSSDSTVPGLGMSVTKRRGRSREELKRVLRKELEAWE